MVNLPNTRADMLPTDFEGVAEALKGKNMSKHVNKTNQRVYSPENNPYLNPVPWLLPGFQPKRSGGNDST